MAPATPWFLDPDGPGVAPLIPNLMSEEGAGALVPSECKVQSRLLLQHWIDGPVIKTKTKR